MGYNEGRRIVDEADPLLLVIGLPVIPIALILAKLIKWEDFVLQLWKRSAQKVPRPLSYLIGQPPARLRANCDQLLQDPGFNEPLGCTRMVCGALLLPTVASLVGKLLFGRVSGSQWRRSLLGGLAFLLFKGVVKIYLRKAQYVRYSQRTIRNYTPASKTSASDQQDRRSHPIESSSSADELAGSSFDGAEHIRGHRPPEDSDDDDADQDDGQLPRARTMFSMTIRL